MRGKAASPFAFTIFIRITPAYAGKSTARRRAYLFFWDHPRICGEKPLEEHGGAVITGSPPHMRGKDIRGVVQNVLFGITPAYAGKSRMGCPQDRPVWDHPRICGEKHTPARTTAAQGGSPPHMRGKGGFTALNRITDGITPAYAGKRNLKPSSAKICGDHPRICGEKEPDTFTGKDLWGSPPHMRGKDAEFFQPRLSGGITPAYAGKRSALWAAPLLHWDHPRICGEKLVILE